VIRADLDDPQHAQQFLQLLDLYMRHPMGAERPLDPALHAQLLRGLRRHPGTHVLLARSSQDAVGMAVCFQGFSTFLARPLLNVHDLIVVPTARRQGVGWQLLTAVERLARELECCRLTLEVRQDNGTARRLYDRFGFEDGRCQGSAAFEFWTKPL
jgi:ribosomal protein S18 acetylase RimI-like enzyme